jgi:hypothetical protein
MRRFGIALALTFALALVTSSALARGLSIQGEDCAARNFNFDGERAFVARETIDARGARSLKAAVDHAPLSVIGDSGGGYTIDVCKAARRVEDLDAIKVTFERGAAARSMPPRRTVPSACGSRAATAPAWSWSRADAARCRAAPKDASGPAARGRTTIATTGTTRLARSSSEAARRPCV